MSILLNWHKSILNWDSQTERAKGFVRKNQQKLSSKLPGKKLKEYFIDLFIELKIKLICKDYVFISQRRLNFDIYAFSHLFEV